MNLAVRITLAGDDIDEIVRRWGAHCDQIIAYEHGEGARVHCHLLLIECNVGTQRLKQLSLRQERGNTFWNYKECNDSLDKYITYMSKGQYEPYMVISPKFEHFSQKEIRQLKDKWVAPQIHTPKKTTYERYMEWEKDVRSKPIDQRNDDTWLRLWARENLFAHHKMITQQYKNDMGNFVETYKFKYHM